MGGEYPNNVALQVNGKDVSMYGLFVEHSTQDLVQWNGEGGKTYFYQSEIPYDVDADKFTGYRVLDHVQTHQLYGAGVYAYFRDYDVTVESGFKAPAGLEFTNIFTQFLNGKGGIRHVLNSQGAGADSSSHTSRLASP